MAITATVRETTGSARLVFANPGLRRVNLALAGSLIGDLAFSTAVSVYAFESYGAAAVGLYYGLRLGLGAVLLPPLAALVDRLPRRGFLVALDLIRMVLVLIAAAVIWLGAPPLVALALALLVSLVGAPFRTAQVALLPALSGEPRELTAANALSSTVESLGFFAGPALAGALLTVATVPVLFVFDAVTFVWSAVLVLGVRPRPTPAEAPAGSDAGTGADRPSLLAEAAAGFRIIGADRELRRATVLMCAQTVVAGAFTVFLVVIAIDVSDLGPAGVGFLNATFGAGALLGGVYALGRASRNVLGRDFGAGVIGWALGPLLVAVWPSLPTALLAMVLMGFGNPLVDVNVMTLIQRLTPGNAIARVFGALESLAVAAMALGAVLMPVLITAVGLRAGLVIIGAPVLIMMVISLPALRRLDQRLAPPPLLPLVSGQELFAPLAPATQEQLARTLITVTASPGTAVINAGEVGDRFYLVQSGELSAYRDGQRLSELGAGDCFGEIALLRDVPRTATVRAVTEVVLQALERDDFLAAVGADPEASARADLLVNRRLAR